jgi:hypothetical protein
MRDDLRKSKGKGSLKGMGLGEFLKERITAFEGGFARVAAILGVTEARVRMWCKQDQHKIPGSRLVQLAEILDVRVGQDLVSRLPQEEARRVGKDIVPEARWHEEIVRMADEPSELKSAAIEELRRDLGPGGRGKGQ